MKYTNYGLPTHFLAILQSSKQIMERKRRGRMTTCLAELKSLLTEVIKTEALV